MSASRLRVRPGDVQADSNLAQAHYNLGQPLKWVIGLRRLVAESVGSCPGEVPRDRPLEQVGLGNQATPGYLEQPASLFDPSQERVIDHTAGRVGQQWVQADDIRRSEEPVQGFVLLWNRASKA